MMGIVVDNVIFILLALIEMCYYSVLHAIHVLTKTLFT